MSVIKFAIVIKKAKVHDHGFKILVKRVDAYFGIGSGSDHN
jgi:hypothetical protein